MEERSIYRDIAKRTGGDIYIGVVGPVRTGKSTFIKRFMDTLVLPNIADENIRRRATDELPQSSAGRTIMTTEPKFVPEQAVEINIDNTANLSVRMIDCVGYIVDSAMGYMEEDMPRMVKTPWNDNEIEFEKAAEIGTNKVINEHSTIGLVITTDGSIGEISRDEYIKAEERVVSELKSIDKPFIILLNCVEPSSSLSQQLASSMSRKYQVPVIPVNCFELDENQIKGILAQILFEFPVREIRVDIPKWLVSLDKENWLKKAVFDTIRENAQSVDKIRCVQDVLSKISENEYISHTSLDSLDLGQGRADVSIKVENSLFFKILTEETGIEIKDEKDLMQSVCRLSSLQKQFEKIRDAYNQVMDTGYGIVMPTMEELSLEEPQIIKQNGKYGIRLKASAPSIHMMRINTTAEVTPIVGSEQQSEELVTYLLKEFEESPAKIWESNIFGKSVNELVNEGLHNKLYRMPEQARLKVGETIEKIINDGCNGLICIIL
ncbi:MAG: stage IV sporulation protein A [Oscillospiraceae bacterium]|nr:stage IV sporulation protein A [Candidatus Ruminococcus equi]